jgi:hypothetical protein
MNAPAGYGKQPASLIGALFVPATAEMNSLRAA